MDSGDAGGTGGGGGAAPPATAVAAAAVAVAVVAAVVTAVVQRCKRLVAEEDKVATPLGTTTSTALPLTGVRRRPVVATPAAPAATGMPTTTRDAQQALEGALTNKQSVYGRWPGLTARTLAMLFACWFIAAAAALATPRDRTPRPVPTVTVRAPWALGAASGHEAPAPGTATAPAPSPSLRPTPRNRKRLVLDDDVR